jgi:hypothetical protein
MSVPTWAGFVTYIPDDEVATAQEIAVYGGRNVAAAMSELFAGLGCSRISEPDYGAEMGWDFRFRYAGHAFWCRVQSFHPIYWLLLEGPSRDEPAHFELWRKFASALEQDPRFDQILWRAAEEGPPDWDEFTISDDLPPRRAPEELPPQSRNPRPKAAGGSLAPVVVVVACVLTGAVFAVVEKTVRGAREQSELKALAIVGLLIGLALLLRGIDWRRKRNLPVPNEGPDAEV